MIGTPSVASLRCLAHITGMGAPLHRNTHDTIYHSLMSRGWESKSVESQMDAAREERRLQPNVPPLTAKEKTILFEREKLLLARSDILNRIESSSHERYIESLRRALEELDGKIAKLLP